MTDEAAMQAAASRIRALGQDGAVLRRVLDVLEDQRTRQDIAGRIAELGDRKVIDPDRIAEELFGQTE